MKRRYKLSDLIEVLALNNVTTESKGLLLCVLITVKKFLIVGSKIGTFNFFKEKSEIYPSRVHSVCTNFVTFPRCDSTEYVMMIIDT